jgi:hypothetical protein
VTSHATPRDLEPRDQDDEATWHRSWQPADLTASLNGTYEPPRPTVGARTDKAGMFYPSRMHTVASESEGGKTWLALSAACDEIAAGNHVAYLDFEDDQDAMVGRLLTLGMHRDRIHDQFHYIRPEDPLGTGINLDDLHTVLEQHSPTLGIVDGVTDAMVLHGLNPLDNSDAAKFSRLLPRRITASGAACVNLDHVTKDRQNRGRYALGAIHKLNGLNGAAYVLENRRAFGIGITGKSTLKISKDRPAQLRANALPAGMGMWWYGDLVLRSHGEEFAEVSIEPPVERSGEFRPTELMARLSRLIQNKGGDKGLSGRQVQSLARGKAELNRTALTLLEIEGYISPTPHKHLMAFTEDGSLSFEEEEDS